MSIDTLFAGIVPFFFVAFGLMWMGFAVYDIIKKSRRK